VSPTATNFSYAGPPLDIPDADLAGVDVPITVTGAGALARLTFSIDGATCNTEEGSLTVGVDHTWVGDLNFVLTSPAGTSVMLINRAGGTFNSGNNFCQTVLQDGAAESIQGVLSTQAPFTGTFSPANPLGAFTGENADGTWTVNVSDNAFFDVGTVRAVSVQASGFSCAP
jgi:subtilisin-like proprotein convertase family protein